MSNLYFLFLHKQRFIHTINFCINTQTGTIVIYSMETPTVSISAAPDFGSSRYGYYDTYIKPNADGTQDTITYSPYAGQMFRSGRPCTLTGGGKVEAIRLSKPGQKMSCI